MKIVHTESSEGWGGQEIRILEESNYHNIYYEHECLVIVSNNAEILGRNPYVNLSIQPRSIGRKNLNGLFQMILSLKAAKPDIVITHSSTDSWLATLARIFLFKKFVLIRVRHVSAPVKNRFSTSWMYKQAARVITTSEHIRGHLIRSIGLEENRVLSIPTGIDCERFREINTTEKVQLAKEMFPDVHTPICLMVSTLRSWKGHVYAIEAIQHLDVTLVVVGDGPYQNQLEELVCELDLSSKVLFMGYDSDVQKYFSIADIFLQPSYANEGVSQSLLQACSFSLPVIVSDIGGLNEVVENNVNGLLVEPKSATSITNGINYFLNNPSKAKEMGVAARKNVVENHSLASMGKRMNEVFLEVLNR